MPDCRQRVGIDPYVEWSLNLGPWFFFRPKESALAEPQLAHLSPQSPLPILPLPPIDLNIPKLSLLLRLNNLNPREFAEGQKEGMPIHGTPLPTGVEWSDIVKVPGLYTDPAEQTNRFYCTARVSVEFFGMLATDELLRGYIYRVALGLPYSSEPHTGGHYVRPRLLEQVFPKPPAVVVGIIDDGLAVANQRFRDQAGGTRVQYLWVQDGHGTKPTPSVPVTGRGAPFPAICGWQFDKYEIEAFIKQYSTEGALDEDALYRALGIVDYRLYSHQAAAQSLAHGTQVMDQACGDDPAMVDPVKPNRPIVAVQLPTRTTATSSGADLSPHVTEAIDYILYCADHLAERVYNVRGLPVVINFSYGRYAGPHDGTHLLEQLIDRRIDQREDMGPMNRLRVVLPAGNNYLMRTHAKLKFGGADSLCTTWRLQPDDLAPNYLEIWLPEYGSDDGKPPQRVTITLTPPGGAESPALGEDPGNALVLMRDDQKALGAVIYAPAPPQTRRAMFLVALAPTANRDETTPIAPSGEWTITLYNDAQNGVGPDEHIYAWIERNSPPLGYPPLGRQSCFDDPDYDYDIYYEPGDLEVDAPQPIETDDPRSYVRRYGTINAYGTGRCTVVIGGYERRSRIVAHYSAAGPALPHAETARCGPDALVPADDSDAHLGVLGAGYRSNSVMAMDGTSVAAPQVARLVADLLENGNPADAAEIQRLATDAEANPPPNLPNPPLTFGPARDGAGRLPLPPVVNLER